MSTQATEPSQDSVGVARWLRSSHWQVGVLLDTAAVLTRAAVIVVAAFVAASLFFFDDLVAGATLPIPAVTTATAAAFAPALLSRWFVDVTHWRVIGTGIPLLQRKPKDSR